jgi:hypothetical protein
LANFSKNALRCSALARACEPKVKKSVGKKKTLKMSKSHTEMGGDEGGMVGTRKERGKHRGKERHEDRERDEER